MKSTSAACQSIEAKVRQTCEAARADPKRFAYPQAVQRSQVRVQLTCTTIPALKMNDQDAALRRCSLLMLGVQRWGRKFKLEALELARYQNIGLSARRPSE